VADDFQSDDFQSDNSLLCTSQLSFLLKFLDFGGIGGGNNYSSLRRIALQSRTRSVKRLQHEIRNLGNAIFEVVLSASRVGEASLQQCFIFIYF
jgi:hypothetical protein